MEILITKDIKISVETFYRPEHSAPNQSKYIFSYQIFIQNIGNRTVQLMRRHWFITDSLGVIREVEGAGVVGKQPILNSGETHQYQSWSSLFTEIGKMYGYYLMVDLETQEEFKVLIPEFQMMASFKNN